MIDEENLMKQIKNEANKKLLKIILIITLLISIGVISSIVLMKCLNNRNNLEEISNNFDTSVVHIVQHDTTSIADEITSTASTNSIESSENSIDSKNYESSTENYKNPLTTEKSFSKRKVTKSPSNLVKSTISEFDYEDFKADQKRVKKVHVFTNSSFTNHSNYKMFSRVPLMPMVSMPKIQGGTKTKLAEYPWAVALFKINKSGNQEIFYSCAGSLINENWVLTAAHCVTDGIHSLRLGDHNLSTPEDCDKERAFCADPVQSYDASNFEIIVNENYDAISTQNDIALIKLGTPADLSANNVKIIGLPLDNKVLPEKIIAVGWGFTSETPVSSDILIQGLMDVNKSCREYIKNHKIIPEKISNKIFQEKQFCAIGGKENRKVDQTSNKVDIAEVILGCQGDSGGSAFWRYTEQGGNSFYYILHGVTSWSFKKVGMMCSGDRQAGVFVDVYSYLNWILEKTEMKS